MCGIAAAGLALSAIGTAMSVSQAHSQAKTQKAMYQRQAQITETENLLRKQDRLARLDKIMGQQRAMYGASGVDPLVGSPADVQANTVADFTREQFMDDFNATNRIDAFNTSAANSQPNYGPSLFQFGSTAVDYAARRANRG